MKSVCLILFAAVAMAQGPKIPVMPRATVDIPGSNTEILINNADALGASGCTYDSGAQAMTCPGGFASGATTFLVAGGTQTQPSTPASGAMKCWFHSSDNTFRCINSAATVTTLGAVVGTVVDWPVNVSIGGMQAGISGSVGCWANPTSSGTTFDQSAASGLGVIIFTHDADEYAYCYFDLPPGWSNAANATFALRASNGAGAETNAYQMSAALSCVPLSSNYYTNPSTFTYGTESATNTFSAADAWTTAGLQSFSVAWPVDCAENRTAILRLRRYAADSGTVPLNVRPVSLLIKRAL